MADRIQTSPPMIEVAKDLVGQAVELFKTKGVVRHAIYFNVGHRWLKTPFASTAGHEAIILAGLRMAVSKLNVQSALMVSKGECMIDGRSTPAIIALGEERNGYRTSVVQAIPADGAWMLPIMSEEHIALETGWFFAAPTCKPQEADAAEALAGAIRDAARQAMMSAMMNPSQQWAGMSA